MDRTIVYAGAIPQDTDILSIQRDGMVGLSKLAAAVLGVSTLANGLTCAPTSPATMTVNIAPGEIYAMENLDGTAFGSLAADTTHTILKQGISLNTQNLACPAPTTTGYSVNYLIEAAYQDVDGTPVTLPYYNAANPSVPFSGPGGSGTPQNTVRQGAVILQAKAGIAAATGTQTTPAPDTGYVGLYVVTVANGATGIASGNISTYSGAPLISETLTQKISMATANANFVSKAQLQQAAAITSNSGGTSDAITGSYTPAIAALSNGMTLLVRASAANTTATPTFTPSSGVISPLTIVKGAGSPLVASDIAGAGHWLELQYDATLSQWVLMNPALGVSAVSALTVKAWVTFDVAAGSPPTVSIVAQHGISGVARNSAGNYTINFNAGVLNDANYSIVGMPTCSAGGTSVGIYSTSAPGAGVMPNLKTTSACQIVVGNGTAIDSGQICILVFGN